MPRIRTIKPDYFKDEKIFDAEIAHGLPLRIAYAGLWTQADRQGRFEWRVRQLKIDVLPYDEVDFSRVLDALATCGFIEKYTHAGVMYGRLRNLKTHQSFNNKEPESKLPASPEETGNTSVYEACTTREPRVADGCSSSLEPAQAERKGKERKGTEGKGDVRVDDESSPPPPPQPADEPTPAEIARQFFISAAEQGAFADKVTTWVVSEGVPQETAERELQKFVDYWTEPTKSGRKVRWETEKTFELRRRIATWFRNVDAWGTAQRAADTSADLTIPDL